MWRAFAYRGCASVCHAQSFCTDMFLVHVPHSQRDKDNGLNCRVPYPNGCGRCILVSCSSSSFLSICPTSESAARAPAKTMAARHRQGMEHENEKPLPGDGLILPILQLCKRNWTGESLIGVRARGRWALFAGKIRDSQGRTERIDRIDRKKWPAAITACNKAQAGRRCVTFG